MKKIILFLAVVLFTTIAMPRNTKNIMTMETLKLLVTMMLIKNKQEYGNTTMKMGS